MREITVKKVFSVTDFGAVYDGKTLTTSAVQATIDACYENGGGEVLIPEGEYLIGDIHLYSGITIHLLYGARLIASRDPEDYFGYRSSKYEPMPDYTDEKVWLETPVGRCGTCVNCCNNNPSDRWHNAVIRAWNCENIAIIGDEGSVIDGMDCYDPLGEEGYRGPHGMSFDFCKNITLSGYTLQRTGNWAHHLLCCENITAENITVMQGHDGFHISECRNVTVKNSRFYTGDDSIAGFGNVNVLVSDCKVNSACSAFRFAATNALITDCHIFAPARYGHRCALTPEEKASSAPSPTNGLRNNMLSAFTYYADASLPIEYEPGNITVENCRIEMADRFLHFNFSGNETWQLKRPLRDITFKNIKASGISIPINAYGSADEPFTLKLIDTDISIRDGAQLTALVHAANCEKITFKSVKLDGFTGDCLVRAWSDVPVEAEVSGAECETVKKAETEFFAKSI